MEEIQDLYNEIKDHERNFKRVLDITCKILIFCWPIMCLEFMISKNKELYEESDSLSNEIERLGLIVKGFEDQI